MTGEASAVTGWRTASGVDAGDLARVEREANLVGLAHVFPPDLGFPDAAVLARWQSTLADPAVTVQIYEDPEPVAFSSWDAAGRLRHLAVVPKRWGEGLARSGIDLAVCAVRAADRTPRLWVLVANDRARGLYAHLGWRPTGVERTSEWPPHPVELELTLGDSPT